MQEKKDRENEESRLLLYEEKRQKVSQFNLTSDVFFSKVMEDIPACQEVICLLTGVELRIKNVKTQYSIRNMENHSVILDVLAEDEKGRIVNVEIHPQEDEDHVRRVRYHLSSIDMSFLEKSMPFTQIPEVYLIYITEKDFIGHGKAIYHVDRSLRGSKELLENGVQELYVNLKGIADSEEQSELLRYMKLSDKGCQSPIFPNLAKRVTMLKEIKEGVEIMCDIIDRERAEGKAEGKVEGKVEGLAEGLAEIITVVRKKHEKQNTPEQAAEALEMEVPYVQNIMNMLSESPRKSDQEIAMQLIGSSAMSN